MKWIREWWAELFGRQLPVCTGCDGEGEVVVKRRDEQIICKCRVCGGKGVL